ncbi:MAG: RimK domain-containing protein, partial [Actinobacteria bacterium]|nr:RimK domain-containing protein [Actinomycetota bacterium]
PRPPRSTHPPEWTLPKAYESRVIVVGDRLFAAGIHADSAETYIDWRNDYTALRYKRIEPPASVAAGILEYCVELGLTYGAFDFVICPDDEWVFLEFTDHGFCCT